MSDILGTNINFSKTASTVPLSSNLPTTSEYHPSLDSLENDVVKDLLENDFLLDQVDSVPFDHLISSNTNMTNTLSSNNNNQFKFANCNVTFNFTK